MSGTPQNVSLFNPLSGEDDGVTEMESVCMNCNENGVTKLLFITIPFYKEVLISSFSCPHCHLQNSEIQSAGTIQEKGATLTLKVTRKEDMNREIVRSDSASVKIPELSFEIPSSSQKGTLSTIEGIITRAIDGLLQEQPLRKALQPETAEKIEAFVEKLRALLTGTETFSIVIDDPSGNSFIENPFAPKNDPNLSGKYYTRTLDQDKALGIKADDFVEEEKSLELPTKSGGLDLTDEVVTFGTVCSNCNASSETRMKMVKIPHFKEVIIMATDCENCGNKTNEVKSGGGFEGKGKKTTLKITCKEDLSRDVLKSETCHIEIPELELETGSLAISGKFTTVEGLLRDLKKMMVESNPFVGGDSATSTKLIAVGQKLEAIANGEQMCTLILDDPTNNSFVQNIYEPEPDPNLTSFEYERTFEQNEELGINDMKVDEY